MDSQSQGLPEKSTPIKLLIFYFFFNFKIVSSKKFKSIFKVLSFISTNTGVALL